MGQIRNGFFTGEKARFQVVSESIPCLNFGYKIVVFFNNKFE